MEAATNCSSSSSSLEQEEENSGENREPEQQHAEKTGAWGVPTPTLTAYERFILGGAATATPATVRTGNDDDAIAKKTHRRPRRAFGNDNCDDAQPQQQQQQQRALDTIPHTAATTTTIPASSLWDQTYDDRSNNDSSEDEDCDGTQLPSFSSSVPTPKDDDDDAAGAAHPNPTSSSNNSSTSDGVAGTSSKCMKRLVRPAPPQQQQPATAAAATTTHHSASDNHCNDDDDSAMEMNPPDNTTTTDPSSNRSGSPVEGLNNNDDDDDHCCPSGDDDEKENDAQSTATKTTPDPKTILKLPTRDNVLASTDALFALVMDPTQVTVKDILRALQLEYHPTTTTSTTVPPPKFDKAIKEAVRERLLHLVTTTAAAAMDQQPEEGPTTAATPTGKSHSQTVGDSDVGESDRSDNDEEEEDDNQTDDDEDYASNDEKPSIRIKKQKSAPPVRRGKTQPPKSSSRRRSSDKATAAASTQLARRVHAEQQQLRRQRRLAELRVRTEELAHEDNQQQQEKNNRLDQDRAAKIAAKFDTASHGQTLERLEQRLDLLSKLDGTRWAVLGSNVPTATTTSVSAAADLPAEDNPSTAAVEIPTRIGEESSEEEEDDDDEMELEIEGNQSLGFRPPVESSNGQGSRFRKQQQPKETRENVVLSKLLLLDRAVRPAARSPLDARALLRRKLKRQQRSMGNQWLARELGYSNEEEHLKDCRDHENTQRELVFKLEREKALERSKRRERLLLLHNSDGQEEDNHEKESQTRDAEDTEKEDNGGEEEEMDEEMELAKTLGEDNNDPVPASIEPSREPENVALSAGTGSIDSTTEGADEGDAAEDFENNDEPGDDPFETQEPSTIQHCKDQNPDEDNSSVKETDHLAKDEPSMSTEEADGAKSEVLKNNKAIQNPKGPRNTAWQAVLKRDAEMARKKKSNNLVEEEADEEEEEEQVAGLEDFGFIVHKKKNAGDDDDDLGEYDDDDLKHVVDDVSDDEGDEAAGDKARKAMEAQEEKEQHKEMIRRMRDGYDGRRGGLAGGGAGARGSHRFDQLVAADNREDAKRLGLLNDDEIDSENEMGNENGDDADEEEDEAALVDKMLKDRFLHRSDAAEEENFSEDEDNDELQPEEDGGKAIENNEEKEQERLAKLFSKRARMQRLIEQHGREEEFCESTLADEDITLKQELQNMKNGLLRKTSQSSSNSATVHGAPAIAASSTGSNISTTLPFQKAGSLATALQASRHRTLARTSFVRSSAGSRSKSDVSTSSWQKTIAFNHVVFHASGNSRSQTSSSNLQTASRSRSSFLPNGNSSHSMKNKVQQSQNNNKRSASLFSQVAASGFSKRRKH